MGGVKGAVFELRFLWQPSHAKRINTAERNTNTKGGIRDLEPEYFHAVVIMVVLPFA